MILEDKCKSLVYAALFHDIGKFYQRTGLNHDNYYKQFNVDDFGSGGAHGKWSADFISNIASFNNDLMEDLVLHHHRYSKSSDDILCAMLSKADSHSCKEREKSDDKHDPRKEPLISSFSKVSLDNEVSDDYFIGLNELSLDNIHDLFPSSNKGSVMTGYTLEREYKSLWNKFVREIKCISNTDDFDSYLFLLKKYTSTIPSAVYTSIPDISLYDHSKTTAALALVRCIYDKKTSNLTKTSDNQDVYLIVNGSISGIQDFIYKVSSSQEAQKGMSKRLRGRSLYISLLSDSIVNYILSELDLCGANVLFSAGGRFTILADNTEDTKCKLNDISDKINDFLIRKFNSELYFSLVYLGCSGSNLADYGDINDRLYSLQDEDKKHKFISNLGNVFELEDFVSYNNTCSVCGNIASSSICDECLSHENLGASVSNADYLLRCVSSKNNSLFDIYFDVLDTGYIFKRNSKSLAHDINDYSELFDYIEVIRLNDTNFLELSYEVNKSNVSFTFKFIANTVPYHPDDGVLSFEQLASINEGSNKLGILKMDVDDLGLIFSRGFDNSSKISISRVSTLSSYLDIFFSGFINNIARKFCVYIADETTPDEDIIRIKSKDEVNDLLLTHNKNNNSVIPTIHINYAGGDDVLVIGPYDDIILFAKQLRQKLKQWTCNNKSINISAGISVVNPRFPIGKAVELADKNLTNAKNAGKDKISLFNEILTWDDNKPVIGFNSLLDYGLKLEEYVNNKSISKGFVYSMLKMWNSSYSYKLVNINEKNWKNDNRHRINHRSYVPHYKYKLRNIRNREIRTYIDKEGIKYMPWIKIPVSWVSLRTR